MDDSWQIKCFSARDLSESISPIRQPLAPALSPAQMDANRCNKFYPSIPSDRNQADDSFLQDPMSFSSLNSIPCAPRKAETGNTFLTFLPGPPLPQPHSSKLPVFNVGTVTGGPNDCSVFAPYLRAPLDNHVNEISAKNNGNFFRPLSLPMLNDFVGSGSQLSCFSAGIRGSDVLSPNGRSGIQLPMLNNCSHQKNELERGTDMPLHGSSFIRGCPRVFCLSKVGELFVSNDGLLGVHCLCHNLRMSVAKFCEHSGLYAVNPGNVVILENGETVAQWRRLFFLNLGVNIPDDASGWNWSNVASASGFFDQSKVVTLPTSKNKMTYQSQKLFDEVRRPDVLPNSQHSYYPVVECSTEDRLLGHFKNAKQRDCIASPHCVPSWLVSEHIPQKAMENDQRFAHSMLNSTSMSGKSNCGRKLLSNLAFSQKASTINPNYDLANSFVGASNDHGAGNSRVHPFVDSYSTLSSIELSLGQPSQQNNRFTTSATLCPVQKNHPITQGYLTSQLQKHAPKGICAPRGFPNSTEVVQHHAQTPEKHYQLQLVDPGEDCNPVTLFRPSHFTAAEGATKSNTVDDTFCKKHSLAVSNLSSNVSAEHEIASYHRGKEQIVSHGDDFYVLKQCTKIDKKLKKDHRAPVDPANSLCSKKKSLNCLLHSASSALEDSASQKESDPCYGTVRDSSTLSQSPKIGFFSSNMVSPSIPVPSSPKQMRLENVQLLEGNLPNSSPSQVKNVQKINFCHSTMKMTWSTVDEVLEESKDHSVKKLRVMSRNPQSCCNYNSSDLVTRSYGKTNLSGNIQDESLFSSETWAKSPVSHVYNSEPYISRTKSLIADQADSRILHEQDGRLVHSKCFKEQIIMQNITSNSSRNFTDSSKGQNLFSPSYSLNRPNPVCKNTALGLHDGSSSDHDQDVLTNIFQNSNVITSGSIKNQLSFSRDKACDGNCYKTCSSKEKRLFSAYPRCSVHLTADFPSEDNNLDCNLVLDEGSAVEKCGSSDDVLEIDDRTKFDSCSSLRFGARDENDFHTCGFSLQEKSMQGRKRNQIHLESTSAIIAEPLMKKKRKKAPKWKRLDASFPTPGAVDKVVSNCHSRMKNSSDETEIFANPRTQKKTSIFNIKCTSQNRKRETCKAVKNLVSERRKKRNFISGDKEDSQDITHEQSRVLPIRKKDRLLLRPVVRGSYGIICNRNMHGKSKPVKIVSLSSLLEVAKRCPITENTEGNTVIEKTEMRSDAKLNLRTKETRKQKLNNMIGHSKDEIFVPGAPGFGHNQTVYNSQVSPTRKAVNDSVGEHQLQKKNLSRLASEDCSANVNYQCRRKPTKDCPSISRKFSDREHDLDAFCSVCRSSKKEEDNSLLECCNCSVKVHQACYGIAKIPKGNWSCRPCRRNSKNIACVLCGYGGGAMTRALRSRSIVKGLLKVWRDGIPSKPFSEVHNSITAGTCDPNIIQWIHMVCGLWTPGTRCPNVHTMSAFDVSGVLGSTTTVCSICKREGGSSIKCRIEDCSVHFHPWCAHQKGLLQSETEGVDDESVGFYGRCLLHATHHTYLPESESPRVKDFSCARVEGFKCRARGCSFLCPQEAHGFVVPADQLNTWLQVKGQKSRERTPEKSVAAETEHDYGKEYARYKRMKGWQHLVVYKSRIHGLGLYTSQFIPSGGVVVEYVGEIVGLRVADKRETEYQSGKKLQYKSACYFFRIDKESIIDATVKGGIARFVNHSCLPNCVAKVIAVENDKKVVFFAERDIRPGEEITYDYNFNREEEGKKIPCFCWSKNCRRYLN